MKNNGNRLLPGDSSMKILVDALSAYNDYLYEECDNIEDLEEKSKKMEQGRKDTIKSVMDKLNNINVEEDEENEIDELNSNIFGVNTTNNGNVRQNANVDENKEQNDDEKKIKNMGIDELVNYINKGEKKNENDKKKKKRKRKNKKGKENEIKTENREEEKDDVFEEFKQDVVNNSINRYNIRKIKFKYDPEKLNKLIEKAKKKDDSVKSLDDTNEKNNNIEK